MCLFCNDIFIDLYRTHVILLFPAFCIHTRLMKERIEPSGFYLKGMLYCAITPVNML